MSRRHVLPLAALLAGLALLVVMNDRFRYRPDAIMVRAGRRVTFAVTNAGRLPHEFTLGDRATQLDHERQMQLADLAGGHALGHWAAGMRGTIVVLAPDRPPPLLALSSLPG